MQKKKYVIRDIESGQYLNNLLINKPNYAGMETGYIWRNDIEDAILFSEKEEAIATILFIEDVIDWEKEEQLEIMEVNTND